MSARAGPGPSTMASTSMVPTSARTKVKKRVVNLVNPADPQDFSTQSISPSTSPNQYLESVEESPKEERITPPIMRFSETTQSFNFTPGVKGILRSTGTPGSGNGVRFFPKNKFRIITPNASTHQPTPKPPPSPTNSFFSQLLAVTIPSMSPRRGSNQEDNARNAADESWEQPGQEGEISLIASSIGSGGDRSIEYPHHRYDEQVDEMEIEESIDVSMNDEREGSWNGQPTIHCSPLTLPTASSNGDTSKDISIIALEQPSADFQYPEDMSNLLSTKFSPADSSFSINDPPSTLAPPRELKTLSPIKEDESIRTEDDFWNVPLPPADVSTTSEQSEMEELTNPTIRRPAPSSTIPTDQAISPTPIGRPYNTSSIFADMSAEQADLTWPLTRRVDDDELDSNYPTPVKSSSPSKLQTPRAGDITEFYDTTMTMSLSSPSPSSTSAIILRSSPQAKDLLIPTKNLFEAQVAHTSALTAEIELYKDLAKKLQSEVVERDECLAKLHLRALDAEVLHTQVQDLQREITSLKSSRKSLSPSPSPTLRAGLKVDGMGMSDRTMAAQSEAKELEIRLAKTLADSEEMARQLQEIQAEKQRVQDEVRSIKDDKERLEDQERDRLVKDQADLEQIETLHKELEDAQQHIEKLRGMDRNDEEIRALQQELEDAHQQLSKFHTQEDEIHALKAELDSAHRQLDDYECKESDLESTQRELEDTQQRLEQVEQILQEANHQFEENRHNEEEISTLRNELQSAHDQIDHLESRLSDDSTIQHELNEANEKIAELKIHVKELTENKLVDEDEIENLINQVDKLKSFRKSEDDMRKRLNEVERRLDIERSRREDMERRLKEEEEAVNAREEGNQQLRGSLKELEGQLTQLRSNSPKGNTGNSALDQEVLKLRSESASKDLEILNLQRRKTELKEDREMLNIALDSKQQELELMKRKFAVRGIAGSTPLATSRKLNDLEKSTMETISTPLPGKGISGIQTRRRSSLALQTPLPNVPKHNPTISSSNLQTPVPGNGRHGVQLHPSTRMTNRVMRKVHEEEGENKPPIVTASVGRSRQRMLA